MESAGLSSRPSPVSAAQFAAFRILFGAWLLFVIAGTGGFLTTGRLASLPSPWFEPRGVHLALVFTAAAFTVGTLRRLAGIILAIALLLIHREAVSSWDVARLALALLVLGCALVPSGEPLSWRPGGREPAAWTFPARLFATAWTALVVVTIADLVLNLLSRLGSTDAASAELPALVTWGLALLEAGFISAVAFRKARPAAWLILTAVQGVVAIGWDRELSWALFWLHLLAFDRRWLAPRQDARTPVLLFDGDCGLCQRTVRGLLREDATGRLRFATLQSRAGQEFLAAAGLPARDFDSLVYVPDWSQRGLRPRRRTEGVCAVLDELGGFARVVSWLRLIPAPVRDAAYRIVAKTRYALFGRYDPRPLADPRWAARFLDR